jgi:hypothetical protein
MESHGTAEQEESPTELPTADSDFDEEEEMRKWLSTTYEPGSKKPMREPLVAPWGLPISDADMEKIKVGFKSRSMDDRWDLLVRDPDEHGNISLHILRSWLQQECYILYIVPKPSNDDGGSAMIHSITWEGNKAGLQCSAEQAKKEAVMVSRSHLDCKFEALPHYPSSMMWDSSGYRRLDA